MIDIPNLILANHWQLLALESLSGESSSLDAWAVLKIVVGVLGGLGLFLYGIEKLSTGLKGMAGNRLKTVLGQLTGNRFYGLIAGAVFTATIQSSSLTTVLVVSFVTAGLMTLQQSAAVIIGSNIGTTLTAQLAAFKITSSAWFILAIGFGFHSLGRRDWARYAGSILLGLGLLFIALEQMSLATSTMRQSPLFLDWMQRLEHPLLGILVGAIFTALVQSSSASTGVVIALSQQGLIQLPAAIAIILGANLGSCVTALLAAIGKPIEARQAAVVHLLFNFLGVAGWFLFIPQLVGLAQATSSDLPRQIANAHTIFNVSSALVLIWFSGTIANAARGLVRYRPGETEPLPAKLVPLYLDDTLLETAPLALDRVRREVGHLGSHVLATLNRAWDAVFRGTKDELEVLATLDQQINHLHLMIIQYGRRLGRRELTHAQSRQLNDCNSAANFLENIGDIISTGLIHQGTRRIENHLLISDQTEELIRELHGQTARYLEQSILAFQTEDRSLGDAVVGSKKEYQALSRATVDRLRVELIVNRDIEPILFQFEIDVIGQYDRIQYLTRQIAKLGNARKSGDVTEALADRVPSELTSPESEI